MGMAGGGLGAVDAIVGAVETISDKEQGNRKTMKKMALRFYIASFVTGGGVFDVLKDSGKAAAAAAAKGESAYLAAANAVWAKSDLLQILIDIKTSEPDTQNPKKVREEFKKGCGEA